MKIKSTEGVTITTNEFKLFQSGFLTGYSLMILGELMSTACFFHTFIFLNLSVEQITKLYVITIAATTVFGVVLEVVDIGSRKNKCVLSAILYSVSMASVFFGGHFDMLLMGRIMFGAASAIHHSAFDAYVIHEHTSQGFPDDWLSQTFTSLTHAMALVAALSGVLGQTAGASYPLGTAALSCAVFALGGTYVTLVWSKDSYNGSRFMLSQFLQSVSQTVQAARANRQAALLIGITSLCESAITIFTYYWAPWMVSLTSESGHALPFEIIFASFVVASLLGTYLTQLFVSSPGAPVTQGGGIPADTAFQGLLVTAAAAFFLGSVFQTPTMSYLVSLVSILKLLCIHVAPQRMVKLLFV